MTLEDRCDRGAEIGRDREIAPLEELLAHAAIKTAREATAMK